jgi:DHA2 family multidrug resistance protein
VSLLGSLVHNQAYVLAYMDGFLVIGWFIIGGLMLIALLRPAPVQ